MLNAGVIFMFNYKKIIKNRRTRIIILKLFSWVPDIIMLKIQYRIKFGRRLNLKEPKRFTEKLQWYKLYYYNPLMTLCAGKNRVRDYVKEKGLEYILNEQYNVYSNANEIDFDELPDRFVLKSTVGSASQQVLVCTDKNSIDYEEVRNRVNSWIKLYPNKRRKHSGREWPYDGVKTEIIAEKYIDSSKEKYGLLSYKIFCFNGEPRFIYLIVDVKDGYFDADYGIYSPDFVKLPYNRVSEANLECDLKKPDNWDEMLHVARVLSSEFPHVRVDLYNVGGKIIFGELTFFNDSGYMRYNPDEFDFVAGDYFKLPQKAKKPRGYRKIK